MEAGLSSREGGDRAERSKDRDGNAAEARQRRRPAPAAGADRENPQIRHLHHHRDSDPFAERSSLIQYEAGLLEGSAPSLRTSGGADDDDALARESYAYKTLMEGDAAATPQLDRGGEEHIVVAVLRILGMCLAQVGNSAINVAYLSLLLPQQILLIVGDDHKGRTLGVLSGAGGILSIVLPPFVGYASDRFRSRHGRRKPFMVAGLAVTSFAFLVAGISAGSNSMPAIVVVYMVSTFGGILSTTAFNATIPDMTEPAQYGTTSGIVGALTIIGYAVGAAIGAASESLGVSESFYILDAVVVSTGLITLWLYREDVFLPPPSAGFSQRKAKGSLDDFEVASDGEGDDVSVTHETDEASQSCWAQTRHIIGGMAGPFAEHDFIWVFITRLLVQFGVFTIIQFMLFWVSDELPFHGLSGTTRASILFIPVFCTALASSLIVGRFTDLNGGKRKSLLVASSTVLGMCSIVIAFVQNFIVAMVFMLVFGFAMGTFMSLDYALVCDVLPSSANVARDLGVWHISIVLPQLVAAPIAGALLDVMNKVGRKSGMYNLGYAVIFLVAALYFFAASASFLKLRHVS